MRKVVEHQVLNVLRKRRRKHTRRPTQSIALSNAVFNFFCPLFAKKNERDLREHVEAPVVLQYFLRRVDPYLKRNFLACLFFYFLKHYK